MSFRKIAAIEGCTDATVSLIATGKIHNPLKPKLRGGRKPILSEEEMYTVARYMFLCKFAHLQDGVIFVKKCFNKTITKRQLSSNIRKKLGFRKKDFIRRYTNERNAVTTLQERYDFAFKIEEIYGESFWWNRISVDEMGLTYLKNTKAWSLVGWVPSEWLPEPNTHLTLILAVSPSIGVVYYEIHQGPVTASIYLGFMQQLLEVAKMKCNFCSEGTFNRIPVVYDNARIYHSVKLNKIRENEDNAKHFAFEFLPHIRHS